jgi:hypothetical protein
VPNPDNLRPDVQLSYFPTELYKPNQQPQLEGLVAMLNQGFAADLLVVLKDDKFELYKLNSNVIQFKNIEEKIKYDLAA